MTICASVQIPGPRGATGASGTNGTNGQNAYTTLTAGFTMPAVSANVTVNVVSSSWASVGQVVFISTAGSFTVASKPSSTQLTLTNLGYSANAAPATVIANGQSVSPAGPSGASGSASGAAGGDLSGTYPNPTLAITTTKGDIIARSSTANTRLAVGADGTRLKADSAAGVGVSWAKVDLSAGAEVTNQLAVGFGGTGGATAAAARTNLGAAASGANSDITSLSALSTPLSIAQGGNGANKSPLFRAKLSGNQSVATGTPTKLTLATEVLDSDNFFDPTVNYRFTPTTAGYYLFITSAMFSMGGAGVAMVVNLYKNGVSAGDYQVYSAGASDQPVTNLWIASANGSGDYFEFYVQHNAGVNKNIMNTEATYFMGLFLRAL